MRIWALLLAIGCVSAPLVTLSAGCGATPTLPLPPPVASVGSPNAQGLVRVEGEANVGAWVYVHNVEREEGVFEPADAVGHYAIEIGASVGETLVIWQEENGLTGERIERSVPAPQLP